MYNKDIVNKIYTFGRKQHTHIPLLLDRSLLEYLQDRTMMERLKPFLMLTMDLNEEEQKYLIASLPSSQRQTLLNKGLIYILPKVYG